jgi:serine/threonine-protein kinase
MTNLLQGGDEAAGPRDAIKVVDMLERGAREADTLAADPPVQAELLHNLASIYHTLGRLDEADGLFATSLERRTAVFGAESGPVAESLVAIGLLRVDQARLDDGENLIRQGLALALRLLPPDHPQVVAASLALGRTLSARGAHDDAIAILTQAAERQSLQGSAPLERAAALAELADAHYAAGHYEQSEALYVEILEQHRALVGAAHPLVAGDLTSLAAIEQDLGYYDKAEELSREALAINETYYGAASSHTADSLTSLGRALTYLDKYDEATVTLRRALAVQESVHGSSHPLVAEAINELGNILSMQSRFDEAAANFQRAADIYRAVHGERHYLVAIEMSNVAYAHMQRKDYALAESLFREVIPLFAETLAPDNVNTGIARIKLGRTLLRAERYAEAAEESLAGYEIVAKQASPSISFLRAARTDLIASYEALQQPETAARFRAESEALEAQAAAGQ